MELLTHKNVNQDIKGIAGNLLFPKCAHVVDLGCGSGEEAIEIAMTIGKFGRVFAVDNNIEMFKRASGETKQLLPHECAEISWINEDAHNVEFNESSIDLVLCRNTIHHFADPNLILGKISQWLKPKGQLIISDILAPDNSKLQSLCNYAERLENDDHIYFQTYVELERMLNEAGFEIQSTAEQINESGKERNTLEFDKVLTEILRRSSSSVDNNAVRTSKISALLPEITFYCFKSASFDKKQEKSKTCE